MNFRCKQLYEKYLLHCGGTKKVFPYVRSLHYLDNTSVRTIVHIFGFLHFIGAFQVPETGLKGPILTPIKCILSHGGVKTEYVSGWEVKLFVYGNSSILQRSFFTVNIEPFQAGLILLVMRKGLPVFNLETFAVYRFNVERSLLQYELLIMRMSRQAFDAARPQRIALTHTRSTELTEGNWEAKKLLYFVQNVSGHCFLKTLLSSHFFFIWWAAPQLKHIVAIRNHVGCFKHSRVWTFSSIDTLMK